MNDWRNSFVKLNAVKGWLFDVYPSGPSEVTVWVIAENGSRVKFVDKFICKLYVSGSFSDLRVLADILADNLQGSRSVAGMQFVEKYTDFTEASKRKALEIEIKDY